MEFINLNSVSRRKLFKNPVIHEKIDTFEFYAETLFLLAFGLILVLQVYINIDILRDSVSSENMHGR